MRILTKALVCMALLFAGASPFTALAQTVSAASTPAAAFAKSLQGRLASFDYSYSMSGSLPMNGSGSVRLQGDAFTMEGNGLDIRCDGKTRWTVDVVAEECYIENIEAQELDYEANPALLVGALDSAFNYKDSGTASFNGNQTGAKEEGQQHKGSVALSDSGQSARRSQYQYLRRKPHRHHHQELQTGQLLGSQLFQTEYQGVGQGLYHHRPEIAGMPIQEECQA